MKKGIPVVLVTGASRGLGRGIALRLAELGMSVAVNYAGNRAAAEETVRLCEKKKTEGRQRFEALKGDIASAEERDELLRQMLRLFGSVDALVNNAGIAPRVRADITETSVTSFREVLQTNLEGPFFLTQRVVNYWLKERPRCRLPYGFKVVFNTSVSADTASVNRAEYSVSKAGLAMTAQLWSVRLAAEGIQVYELRPGIMATDMTKAVQKKYDELLAQGVVPQRRWGRPEDVGLAVGALLTGLFPYSTGEVIYIDGGFHLRQL
jgi:NAD(P)-dependent dehydrogenase (short-subunit alcohol dehydrogenase family)